VLEAAGLDCERGGKTLFRGLSFALSRSELLRIAGANGSGKTSLLRILCGLLAPARGKITWQGTPIRELREDYCRQLVYIGHAPAVKDDLTASENLAITCALAGISVQRPLLDRVVTGFKLPGSTVRRFSQGQRRRAALARLALSEAVPLWLLDEPFAALDDSAVKLMEDLIAKHSSRGGIVVYTTHQDAGLRATRVIEL
jgi:heme exporter protein A